MRVRGKWSGFLLYSVNDKADSSYPPFHSLLFMSIPIHPLNRTDLHLSRQSHNEHLNLDDEVTVSVCEECPTKFEVFVKHLLPRCSSLSNSPKGNVWNST